MAEKSLLVPMVLCWNELPYLKNLIPQYQRIADEIVILDGNSSDGTCGWFNDIRPDKVRFYQREFDTCAKQFNYALQQCPKDNAWIINLTGDELPTSWFFDNIRSLLDDFDNRQVDRAIMTVYHLRAEREMSNEIGGQLRIFRNDAHHKCKYVDYPHERLSGQFDGHCVAHQDDKFAFVHFRQADPEKVKLWKTHYIEKGVYSAWDINRRLKVESVPLHDFITYNISDNLKKHLGWL